MIGSGLSVLFLAPTIRDVSARIPLGTSIPSMTVGGVYAFTFGTMGMTLSAVGALATAIMWTVIATLRSPRGDSPIQTRRDEIVLFSDDTRRFVERTIGGHDHGTQYLSRTNTDR
ncbi:hypothetical protein [Halostagnicola sp. A-GB9-2]|uniref:hypothetical protein n=1 Tax=Halostagnicola sp. A-GB9-2 TaxID=3048066 RepID=UPI0024BF90A8|nr:hypothetical protein [Halostagnicola sp. A-GB9-2]MDJ1433184.1 hypothetical protein [Halostagnicola sp. A-GB9-2]